MKLSSDLYRYGLVIAVCCIAIVVGWISGAEASCLFLAIMVGSLYGGRYPSLMGIGIAAAAFDFFFLAPRYSFSVSPNSYPRFIAFAAATFVIRYLIRSREEKIGKNAQELRELIDFIPHHVLVLDPAGQVLEANQMVLDYIGRNLDQMKTLDTGERIRRDIHPDDIEKACGERQRSLSSGVPFEIERRALGKDGNYRWFLFRYKPLVDRSGDVTRWFCTATDIEDMKREDERLRLAVDATPAFIHTARPDGLVDHLNQRWLDYLGLPMDAALVLCDFLANKTPQSDLSSWEFSSVIHPEDLAEITETWKRVVTTGKPEDHEARVRRFDGTYRWFLFRASPLYDNTRKIIKWYGASTDIEDHKRAEEELRQREVEIADQLRLVINTTPGLAWTARPDGSADFVNRQWLEYAGLSTEEAIGWGFLIAIHPDDMPRMMEDYKRVLNSGGLFETEGRVRRHDGEYRRFLFRGSVLRDSVGNIVKWVGINTDVEDHRRAEDALRESEQNLRLIVDSIPGLIHAMTPSGEVEIVSQRVMDFFGKTFEELKDWTPLLHPDDYERVLAIWRRSLETGEPVDIEHRVLRADGTYAWVHSRSHSLRDSANHILRWYYLITEIDERKKAEEQLRRSEAYLLEAQRLSHTGSFAWTVPVGDPIYLSDECFRIYGFDRREGMPSWEERRECVHPDDRDRWQDEIERAIRKQTAYEVEYRINHPSGVVKYVHAVGHPVLDKSGKLIEFVGTAMDITERWKAQEALRESEHHLRLLIEAVPALIWCAMPGDGKVVYVNQRFCNYTGRTLDELLGCMWITLIHPDDVGATRTSWRYALETGEPHEITHRYRRADGEYRWFRTLAEPFRDRENRITQWYGLNVDIDDSRQMAEALRTTQTRLSRATQIATVAELSASIAHEINQPLAAVVAHGEACDCWLSTDPPNLERARLAVQRIIRDGNAAAQVIQQIRALFKRETLNKVELDMNEVIEEVLRLVANEIQRKHVSVQTELSRELPKILADRVQMQQVMINLVNNAIEAMEGAAYVPKVLLLSSRRDSLDTILIEICDHGTGLENVEKVFEPFFTMKEKGMGMGLSICRSIIEAHEGSIAARRNQNWGTTFSFTLPILVEKPS